eukprot:m.274013 g.274013  ORF g.274013 m.274013 type:complete len:438 (-) comp110048_c0_seq1:315-1628(-)
MAPSTRTETTINKDNADNGMCSKVLSSVLGPGVLFLGMCVYAGSAPLFKKMALEGNHQLGNNHSDAPNSTDISGIVYDIAGSPLDLDFDFDSGLQVKVPSSKIVISPCNVLFTGNLIAAIVTIIPCHRDLTCASFRKLSRSQWIGLLTVTVLQTCLARFAELYALLICPPSDVIPLMLTGRLEPPITFLLTRLIFSRKTQPGYAYVGNFISTMGVFTALVFVPLAQHSFLQTFDKVGVGYTFGATMLDGIGGGLSFVLLQDVPVGIYLVIRSGIGAIFFFVIATLLFGIEHFYGCWKPEVLKYMLLWSGGYILAGNLLWFVGVSRCSPLQISLVGAFFLPMSLVFTELLLGAAPSLAQFIGSAIIMAAVVFCIAGEWFTSARTRKRKESPEHKALLINDMRDIDPEDAVEYVDSLFANSFLAKALADTSGMFRSNVM